MLVALDAHGNRLYAEDEGKYTECFCPACGEAVKHKKGTIRHPYFAHMPNSGCHFGQDKDNKSEWHIRMQEYFPKEKRECLFIDEETGERHIADVFVNEANAVLEFQHSPISEQEFLSRTMFHMKNKRRIVWLFDESSRNENRYKFKRDEEPYRWGPYQDKHFKWLYRRKVLERGPDISKNKSLYSICVYTGREGDMFHRIVSEEFGFEEVTFSLHDLEMGENIDVEDFFRPETYWQGQEPWKTEFEAISRERDRQERERQDAIRLAESQMLARLAYKLPRRRRRW
ncbi:MAG: hypothetical protein IJQ46_05985 [Oscillospiraceae bacterium]|nr:hypothetical protein [Oscillospiraceae bacterium]